jgi:hypothetical protein
VALTFMAHPEFKELFGAVADLSPPKQSSSGPICGYRVAASLACVERVPTLRWRPAGMSSSFKSYPMRPNFLLFKES